MYVDITDPAIISNTETDGRDILFTDATGTLIPFIIEEFNQAAGTIKAHLKIDISKNHDSLTYLFFGNSNATDAQNTTGGVFSSDTIAAFLFNDESKALLDPAFPDRSANPILTGLMTTTTLKEAGEIGNAAHYSDPSGSASYGTLTPKMTLTNKFTIISVIKRAFPSNNPVWLNMGPNVNTGITLLLGFATGIPRINLKTGTAPVVPHNLTTSISTLGEFHTIAFTYDGANVRGYNNGNLEVTGAQSGNLAVTHDDEMQLGNSIITDLPWGETGRLDDIRIYNTVKSDDFIKTTHNNYFNPEVFTTQSEVKDNNG